MAVADRSFRLDGRRVLLTGAAGTIGAALAGGLAEAGADVLLIDRAAERLATVADEVGARCPGVRVERRVIDITSGADLDQIAGERVDILVNNAYAGSGSCAGSV